MRCSLLKLHVEIKKKQCLKITSNCVFKATVYRVIFSHVILPFYICKRFRPVSILLRHISVLEIIWDIGIHPVLNLPSDIDK